MGKINIPDVKIEDTKCDVTTEGLVFKYADFALEFKFRLPVNDKTVKYRATRVLELVIEKEKLNDYWPHLLSKTDKKKYKNQCKIDWDRFLDEEDAEKKEKGILGDEDDDKYSNLPGRGGPPGGGMPGGMPGGMGGMANMMGGGAGGMDFASIMGGMGGGGMPGGA